MPSFVEIGRPVPKKSSKNFTIYRHGGPLGHVAWIIDTYIGFSLPIDASYNIWPKLAKRFLRRSLELWTDEGRTPLVSSI